MDFSALSFSDGGMAMDDLETTLLQAAQDCQRHILEEREQEEEKSVEVQLALPPANPFLPFNDDLMCNESLNLSDILAPLEFHPSPRQPQGTAVSSPSPPQQIVPVVHLPEPLVNTPLLAGTPGGIMRQAKRKIWEVNPDLGQSFKDKQVPPLKSMKRMKSSKKKWEVKVTKRATPTEDLEGRPRILLKFKLHRAPNPVPPDLAADLARGTLLNSMSSIHSELLFAIGAKPVISDPTIDHYAITSTYHIDEERIRRKVNFVNKLTAATPTTPNNKKNNEDETSSGKVFDLDAEYERLLQRQIPDKGPPPPSPKEGEEKPPEEKKRAEVRVTKKGIILVKLAEREFLVERSAVVIPRLTQPEIDVYTAPHHFITPQQYFNQ